MNGNKLTRKDLRWVLAALVFGGAGLIFTLRNYSGAFPEAAIDFKMDKSTAQTQGSEFLRALGIEVKDYKKVTVFNTDSQMMNFIQKNVAPEELDAYLTKKVKAWWWATRWFKPLQKEEFQVRYSPLGEFVGFEHEIAEDAQGDDLSVEDARRIANDFLLRIKELTIANYAEVEASLQKKPHRTDHIFTYELKDFKLAEATYRIQVTVQGNQIGGVDQSLKIPEKWLRDFETMHSRNDLLAGIAMALCLPLVVALVVVFLRGLKSHNINWQPALLLSLLMFVLSLLNNLNSFPLQLFDYQTTEAYPNYIVQWVLRYLVGAIINSVVVFFLAAGGELLYRDVFRDKIRLDGYLQRKGWWSKEAFLAPVIGYCAGMLMVGYVVMFYLYGRRLGVWVPLDVSYSNLTGTVAPAIQPMAISVSAALMEEFFFRLFAISWLKKYLKSDLLAILIPAFLWGFLHSNYPQEPSWIRGVEVGIAGIMAGLIFVRFGIMASLIWHYSVDAALIGLFLFQTKNAYHIISGALTVGVMLLPFCYALWRYLQRRGFSEDRDLSNGAGLSSLVTMEKAVREQPELPRLQYQPLGANRRLIAIALTVIGGGLLWLFPPLQFGDFIRLSSSRDEIQTAAERYFTMQLPEGEYLSVVADQKALDETTAQYLREQLGAEQGYRLYAGVSSGFYWYVRYFKPLEKEEWHVLLNPSGALYAIDHRIPEEVAGANLEREQAIAKGEFYITRDLNRPLDGFEVVEANKEQQPDRSDWHITWQSKQHIFGQAFARHSVTIQGAEPTDYRFGIKLPEDWERLQERVPLSQTIAQVVEVVIYSLGTMILVFAFFNALLKGRLPWRSSVRLAALVILARVVQLLLGLPASLKRYPTTESLSSYLTSWSLSHILLQPGLMFLGVLLLAASVQAIWNLKGPGGDRAGRSRLAFSVDGILAALGVGAAVAGWISVCQHVIDVVNPSLTNFPVFDDSHLSSLIPGMSSFADCIQGCVFYVLVLAALWAVWNHLPSRRVAITVGFALLSLSLAAISARSWAAFGLLAVKNLGLSAIVVTGLMALLRRNVFGMVTLVLLLEAAPMVITFLNQPSESWRFQGMLLAGLAACALALWGLLKEPVAADGTVAR